jgi:hypothetical protein
LTILIFHILYCRLLRNVRTIHRQLAVTCINHPSCATPCTIETLAKHERECGFSKVSCLLCRRDVNRRDYLVHVNDLCSRRVTICTECNKSIPFDFSSTHAHRDCPGHSTPCAYCGILLRRELHALHHQKCPKVPRLCTKRNLGCACVLLVCIIMARLATSRRN